MASGHTSKKLTYLSYLALGMIFLAGPSSQAEEGMWTFDNPPSEALSKKYNFKPSQEWLDHLQASSVRFMDGGSGAFVSPRGLVVTNHHVIRGAHFATVKLSSGATLFVEGVAAVDADADLAVLKVNGKGLAFLTLGPATAPKVGTKVYAIGNPLGMTNSLSEGRMATGRTQSNAR